MDSVLKNHIGKSVTFQLDDTTSNAHLTKVTGTFATLTQGHKNVHLPIASIKRIEENNALLLIVA